MGRIEFDLDVLKPHIPSNYGLAQALEEVPVKALKNSHLNQLKRN
ncbi:MAG: hypothetical protein ACTSQU_14845 [Promethearchaeota archaeon]